MQEFIRTAEILEFLQTKISELKIQSGQEEQLAKQIKKDLTDLEEKIVSGGNLEIKENSLVVRLQQIQKIEDQQKRYQDLEKKAERKKKGYLTASQKRTEIKEILNKMEQAYLDAQAGDSGSRIFRMECHVRYVVLFIIRSLRRFRMKFPQKNS